MTETEKSLEPRAGMSAQQRFGFVSLLWWATAIFGIFNEVQEPSAGRKAFVGFSCVLAIIFTFAWGKVRKGRPSE